jgi:D-alanine-D-alanine ligase-like ATP-grasp enzyme
MNSASKLRMKTCFTRNGVKTADWYIVNNSAFASVTGVNDSGLVLAPIELSAIQYPLVAKHVYGSRGTGNYLLQNVTELNAFLRAHQNNNYIYERYHDYNREYRLHITGDGCFYTCRKLIKEETPEDKRWFRNDSNSVWVVEDNPSFDKPINWDSIVAECVKALNAVGLDFGACDVRVQSSKDSKGNNRKDPKFFIVEINSAPSFGTITSQKYLEILPALLMKKYSKWKTVA